MPMMRGRDNWVACRAVLACCLVVSLAACAAQAPPATPVGAENPTDSAAPPAAPRAIADNRQQQIDDLKAELAAQRELEAQLRTALKHVIAVRVPEPRPTAGGPPPGAEAPSAENTVPAVQAPPAAATSAELAALRAAVARERHQREAVEAQLARLEHETARPALADARVPEADYLAAQDELRELRRQLAEERAARERLAEDLRQLQQARLESPAATPAANAEREARIVALEQEKAAITESFNRSLESSRKEIADLEVKLAASDVRDAASTASESENRELRARLDEEHRRTEELAAKLRVATRVADLIFKIQAQSPGAEATPR